MPFFTKCFPVFNRPVVELSVTNHIIGACRVGNNTVICYWQNRRLTRYFGHSCANSFVNHFWTGKIFQSKNKHNRKPQSKQQNRRRRNRIRVVCFSFCIFLQFAGILFHSATMRRFINAVFSFTFAASTVRSAKLTNTTPVDSTKTGGQIIMCNHYSEENPEASEAFWNCCKVARLLPTQVREHQRIFIQAWLIPQMHEF